MRHAPLIGLLALLLSLTLAAQSPTIITPADAIGFDYLDVDAVTVTRYEVNYDSAAAWTSLNIPASVVLPTTLPGGKTYKVVPPFTSGTHTVLFRACNSAGCGSASVPFGFVYAATSPTVAPGNVRTVPR